MDAVVARPGSFERKESLDSGVGVRAAMGAIDGRVRVAGWVGVLLVALGADVGVAGWVRSVRPMEGLEIVGAVVWCGGHFAVTAAVGLGLCAWHGRRWKAGVQLMQSAVVASAIYVLVKWGVGRTRPFKGVEAFDFEPFERGIAGLIWAKKNSAFPSGHACLAFSMAACLSMLAPRWWWFFYSGAVMVGVCRVLEGAHYLSDVVAGAGVGVVAAWLMGEGWRAWEGRCQKANVKGQM